MVASDRSRRPLRVVTPERSRCRSSAFRCSGLVRAGIPSTHLLFSQFSVLPDSREVSSTVPRHPPSGRASEEKGRL
jgi:hypothetical protein